MMCDTIYLPNRAELETIRDLERAFGLPVDAFHLLPHLLRAPLNEVGEDAREVCLCYVDLEAYLEAVQATWHYQQPLPGDITILMMPPRQVVSVEAYVP